MLDFSCILSYLEQCYAGIERDCLIDTPFCGSRRILDGVGTFSRLAVGFIKTIA